MAEPENICQDSTFLFGCETSLGLSLVGPVRPVHPDHSELVVFCDFCSIKIFFPEGVIVIICLRLKPMSWTKCLQLILGTRKQIYPMTTKRLSDSFSTKVSMSDNGNLELPLPFENRMLLSKNRLPEYMRTRST